MRKANINIAYQCEDGYHLFTSDDIFGLFVGGNDLDEAFDSISPMIERLMKLNHDIECTAQPTITLPQYLAGGEIKKDADQTFQIEKVG